MAINWDVVISSATQELLSGAERAILRDAVTAAGDIWGRYLDAENVTITVEIVLEAGSGSVIGGSLDSEFVEQVAGIDIFQVGTGYELATGIDPNGSTPDARLIIDPAVFRSSFIDPDPDAHTADVPDGEVDFMSILLRLLGRAIGFSGFHTDNVFDLPDETFVSTYENNIEFLDKGNIPVFAGDAAVAVYGEGVPVTTDASGDASSIGNSSGQAGDDLIPELMNGVGLFDGTRYAISPLTVAILEDSGVPIREATSGADELYGFDVIDPQLVANVGGVVRSFFLGADDIAAGAGNDTVFGLSGSDTLAGDAGADELYGDAGNDVLVGGTGDDLLFGGDGNDMLMGD